MGLMISEVSLVLAFYSSVTDKILCLSSGSDYLQQEIRPLAFRYCNAQIAKNYESREGLFTSPSEWSFKSLGQEQIGVFLWKGDRALGSGTWVC